MPVDTSAKSYTWYMTEVQDEQLIRMHWEPGEETISSSMAPGLLTIDRREGAEWVSMQRFPEMLWVVAQSMAKQQGFNVEVANHGT